MIFLDFARITLLFVVTAIAEIVGSPAVSRVKCNV
jgi:hypothetical protein